LQTHPPPRYTPPMAHISKIHQEINTIIYANCALDHLQTIVANSQTQSQAVNTISQHILAQVQPIFDSELFRSSFPDPSAPANITSSIIKQVETRVALIWQEKTTRQTLNPPPTKKCTLL
jgi:hypothetical protein